MEHPDRLKTLRTNVSHKWIIIFFRIFVAINKNKNQILFQWLYLYENIELSVRI